MVAKAQAAKLLDRLPDDCTFDDIHYHLYVVEKINRGLESKANEPTFSSDEARTRLARWLPNTEARTRLARWLPNT